MRTIFSDSKFQTIKKIFRQYKKLSTDLQSFGLKYLEFQATKNNKIVALRKNLFLSPHMSCFVYITNNNIFV
jgi:hypothetical protein